MAEKRELTLFEAASIVAGYGVGAGIMAVPYLVARTGTWVSLAVIAASYGVSVLLHLMIAQLALGVSREGRGVQIVEIFRAHLFRGRLREVLQGIYRA